MTTSNNPLTSLFRTTGVANIEATYTRAGGHANGLPGHAHATDARDEPRATETESAAGDGKETQGSPQKGVLAKAKSSGTGTGSLRFEQTIGDQKPEPGVLGKAWNSVMMGSERGK